MKSDIVRISSAGEGMQEALLAATASADYRGLGKKDAIHLRLLAEEMLGMMRQVTHEAQADFWVQSEGGEFELHLVAHPTITGKVRKELLKISTSGKNEAAKGFMGKIRDLFDRALTAAVPEEGAGSIAQGFIMPAGMFVGDPMTYDAAAGMITWSMNHYISAIKDESEHDSEVKEEWDELEKSIVANIADEVKIAIAGDTVEMTVYKSFTM